MAELSGDLIVSVTEMVNKARKDGQAFFFPLPMGEGKGSAIVEIIPIRQARTGAIVRFKVQSLLPQRERGE